MYLVKGDALVRKNYEPEYDWIKEIMSEGGNQELGIMSAGTWIRDPKRLTFVLSRYKFVAKMFSGFQEVLELGAADGWPSRIVRQNVSNLTCLDFDPELLNNGKKNMHSEWPITFLQQDLLEAFTLGQKFDGIFALDVLEHIDITHEAIFFENIISNIKSNGVCIIGMPSIESQRYTYKDNGHINCKTGSDLRRLNEKYFERVLMFSMNDEVVHTGFDKMAQYIFAVSMYPISSA